MAIFFLQRYLTNLRDYLWHLSTYILPPLCLLCSRRIEDGVSLCSDCWNGLIPIEPPLRARSGLPLSYCVEDDGVLEDALYHSFNPAWDRIRGCVLYNDFARRLVHGLKYHDRHEYALLMGRLMARCGKELIEDADMIVALPLHWTRLWARRYNQSTLLAQALCDFLGRDLDYGVLHRVRRTKSQVGLRINARRDNMRGAFSVGEDVLDYVDGKRILLIDDVMTTGSTLDSCARTLYLAGARGVDGLVFALVPDKWGDVFNSVE